MPPLKETCSCFGEKFKENISRSIHISIQHNVTLCTFKHLGSSQFLMNVSTSRHPCDWLCSFCNNFHQKCQPLISQKLPSTCMDHHNTTEPTRSGLFLDWFLDSTNSLSKLLQIQFFWRVSFRKGNWSSRLKVCRKDSIQAASFSGCAFGFTPERTTCWINSVVSSSFVWDLFPLPAG